MDSIMTVSQQDRLKGWLQLVRKKTARLSTRITARLGLISLTRDEEFERHYENFKHIEKTIRSFVKNLNAFVEHFENFLISLQGTSDNLAEFYRDKAHHKELDELRRKNKALASEHFHAFKRTVNRHVISVSIQLLQKFSGPHQLVNKRSAKLLDYDNRSREMEACSDESKKASIRDQYVIAKNIYDRINKQLIEELPLFNQFALIVFKESIMVLLESRRNLILSYTKQTASLLDTPLMMTYTASEVASNILMSCGANTSSRNMLSDGKQYTNQMDLNTSLHIVNEILENGRKYAGSQTTGHSSNSGQETSRPQSTTSHSSSDFERLPLPMTTVSREISSTPLSNVDEQENHEQVEVSNIEHADTMHSGRKFDELDGQYQSDDGFRSKHEEFVAQSTNDSSAEIVEKPISKVKRNHNVEKEPPSSPSSTRDQLIGQRKSRKHKFPVFMALWPFVATGPNQLTIVTRQHLRLIKPSDECGNSDWSLVQDKRGQVGYVPSSYIIQKS